MPAGQATVPLRRMRAVVRGRVQGVGYRAATAAEATRLGLVGWVRNRPDGQVELEAEGPPATVAALLTWCARGPALAQVTGVDTVEIAVVGESSFAIRR